MQYSEKSAKKAPDIREFSRFLLVGISNFIISFVVFYFLYNYWKLSEPFYALLGQAGKNLESLIRQFGATSMDAALANLFGYGAGVINSFLWNKLWTFKARHETASQFVRFITLNINCLLLSSLSLFIFTDYLRLAYGPVWFVTMGAVTVINYLVSKYWVFVSNSG